MSIAYPDWSPQSCKPEPQAARTGMAAFLGGHRRAEPPTHRWKSVAATVIGHAVLIYIVLFVMVVVPKKLEMQTITVSITETRAARPEPAPVPKLEKMPQIVQPKLPQIETPAMSSPNSISVAAPIPPAPPVQDTKAKAADVSDITPPVFDAAYLNNPAPVYPNMSRRLREVGVVQLRVRVTADGAPLEIQMAKSSGYDRLDESAKAAVQKWKFAPAKRNGNAVEAWVIVPVEFSLTRS